MKKIVRIHPVFFLVLLLCVAGCIWYLLFGEVQEKNLRVSFLDVGQGDAILIESPTGTQVLVDAGPYDGSIAQALPKVIAPWDRKIDIIIVSNTDQDHFGGFIDVLSRYDIGAVFEPGTEKKSPAYEAFTRGVEKEGLASQILRRGTVFNLGGGAYIRVLVPDRDVSKLDPNVGSSIMELVYGDTHVLLTGDATDEIETYALSLEDALKTDILKVGHHGSRTSTGEEFLAAIDPTYAVISASCDNSYGHPHREVVGRLLAQGVQILTTCEDGTIEFESNGREIKRVGN